MPPSPRNRPEASHSRKSKRFAIWHLQQKTDPVRQRRASDEGRTLHDRVVSRVCAQSRSASFYAARAWYSRFLGIIMFMNDDHHPKGQFAAPKERAARISDENARCCRHRYTSFRTPSLRW
jgi:hypothetical protein